MGRNRKGQLSMVWAFWEKGAKNRFQSWSQKENVSGLNFEPKILGTKPSPPTRHIDVQAVNTLRSANKNSKLGWYEAARR